MASGSFSNSFISGNSYYKLIVEWSSTPNTSANTSTVKATVKLSVYSLYINGRTDNYVTINGKTYNFDTAAISKGSPTTITLGTVTSDAVKHNADGSKSISIKAGFKLNATISGTYYGTVTASKTVALDDIPRAATIESAPNFNDEGNPTISYSNPAGTAVEGLAACISTDGSSDDLAAYREISKTGSSYTFNLTDAERAKLRNACKNAKSMTVRFYVRTILGGETYRKYVAKTLTIVNAAPTLLPAVKDSNDTTAALTGDRNRIVKGYSDVLYETGAAALKGATIRRQEVTCGSRRSTAAAGTLHDVDSATFNFTVTDSRGNVTKKTLTRTLVNYVELTCHLKANNPTADGEMAMTVSGNCFSGSFGAVTNTITVQYRMKSEGGDWGSWTDLAATVSGSKYTATANITGLDYQTAYTFQARAIDKLKTSGVLSASKTVKAAPVFDWGENDFSFNVPVEFNADMVVANYKRIYFVNASGERRSMIVLNSTNDMFFGYGSRDSAEGRTFFDGNEVYIRSNEPIRMDNSARVPNAKYFGAAAADGTYYNLLGINGNNNLLIGYGMHDAGVGNTYLYGNGEVGVRTNGSFLVTSPTAGLSSRAYGVNKVLASPGRWMTESHVATLSEAVSAQPNGIVLVWSLYDGEAHNYDWSCCFVPKYHVTLSGSGGVFCQVGAYQKYVYIRDTEVTGYSGNASSTSGPYVLRYIIGV